MFNIADLRILGAGVRQFQRIIGIGISTISRAK